MGDRPICEVEGCNRAVMSRGNGRYYKLCYKHHREKYGMSNNNAESRRKSKLRNEDCLLCGWKGPCDLHRLRMGKGGGKYTKGNTATLCPNCHRLLHIGQMSIK